MRIGGVTLLVLVCILAAGGAQAQSQADMTETACDVAQKADAELNAVYAAVLKKNKNDPQFIKKLKIAQRAWLAYRDAELAALYPAEDKAAAYGSSFGMCHCAALADLTRKRTAELLPWRDGVEEGDGCSGSYPIKAAPAR